MSHLKISGVLFVLIFLLLFFVLQEKSKLVVLQNKLEQLFRAGLAGGHYDNGAEASSDTEEVNSIFQFRTVQCGKYPRVNQASQLCKRETLV